MRQPSRHYFNLTTQYEDHSTGIEAHSGPKDDDDDNFSSVNLNELVMGSCVPTQWYNDCGKVDESVEHF